jgi:hypothetical protein
MLYKILEKDFEVKFRKNFGRIDFMDPVVIEAYNVLHGGKLLT